LEKRIGNGWDVNGQGEKGGIDEARMREGVREMEENVGEMRR